MKIRNGFVSNSSSSSFLIALDKPIQDYKDFEEFAEEYDVNNLYGETLYRDLQTAEANLKEYIKDMDVSVDSDLDIDVLGFDKSNEIVDECAEFFRQRVLEEVEKQLGNAQYRVVYEDSSEFGSYMEHHFVPEFRGTISSTSHH